MGFGGTLAVRKWILLSLCNRWMEEWLVRKDYTYQHDPLTISRGYLTNFIEPSQAAKSLPAHSLELLL